MYRKNEGLIRKNRAKRWADLGGLVLAYAQKPKEIPQMLDFQQFDVLE